MHEFFKTRIETASFRMPGSDTDIICKVEFREDPLTGRTSVICENLLKKVQILYGETDRNLIDQLVNESRANCIFCPPLVFESTPRYPETLCPGGRLLGKESILFPNLFPIAEIHAVMTWPDNHFLTPGQFTFAKLSDLFSLATRFISDLEIRRPSIEFISFNCNYMPPAGASVIHPHFQLVGTREPPYRLAKIIHAAYTWSMDHHENYWDILCRIEREQGDRWIGMTGRWHWIAAWSPLGANEIISVHESARTLYDLDATDWNSLAEGLNKVLSHFDERAYSSFNVCLAGGTRSANNGQRCVLRVISRQNVKSMYRNDEYFLQKFHGIELIVTAPETIAAELKHRFNG
ncbi:hypothetical protein JW823_08430 [bacterium]|nr:hypothetical protein [candidate division CSSED10-310 bacterium]